MDRELCILFAYHRVDSLTLRHFDSLRKFNPGHTIIPITDDIGTYLPGTIDVKNFEDPWPKTNPWRRCDTMLYRWFLNRSLSAKRYLLLEYDCLCTVDVAEAYADVWNADVAARDLYIPDCIKNTSSGEYISAEWSWFSELDRLSSDDRPFASALVPLVGILFSHEGLEAIVANASRRDIFCELRIGTAARKAGLQIVEFPQSLKRTIWWDSHPGVPDEPGVWHSVKSIPASSASGTETAQSTDNVPKRERNLALHCPATQSSVSEWSNFPTLEADASGGNNGVIDGRAGFHTRTEPFPWWQVDLLATCEIRAVRIFNRQECAFRLRHFFILGSLDGSNWTKLHRKTSGSIFGESDLKPYTAEMPVGTVAKFIRIQLNDVDCLHFCECEVLGTETN